MERLTLAKEQRRTEGVGFVKYLNPEILAQWDERLTAYEDTGLAPEEVSKILNAIKGCATCTHYAISKMNNDCCACAIAENANWEFNSLVYATNVRCR